jgi:hypothetical protein
VLTPQNPERKNSDEIGSSWKKKRKEKYNLK